MRIKYDITYTFGKRNVWVTKTSYKSSTTTRIMREGKALRK